MYIVRGSRAKIVHKRLRQTSHAHRSPLRPCSSITCRVHPVTPASSTTHSSTLCATPYVASTESADALVAARSEADCNGPRSHADSAAAGPRSTRTCRNERVRHHKND